MPVVKEDRAGVGPKDLDAADLIGGGGIGRGAQGKTAGGNGDGQRERIGGGGEVDAELARGKVPKDAQFGFLKAGETLWQAGQGAPGLQVDDVGGCRMKGDGYSGIGVGLALVIGEAVMGDGDEGGRRR